MPCAVASTHKPDGLSVATGTAAASSCLFPGPAPSSLMLCLQRQMAGHGLNLFRIVNPFLEVALIYSAASQWLGMFSANYCHFHLGTSLCLYHGRAVFVFPRNAGTPVLGEGWPQDTFVSLQRQSWSHSYFQGKLCVCQIIRSSFLPGLTMIQ